MTGMLISCGCPVSGAWGEPGSLGRFAVLAEELGYHGLWAFQRLLEGADQHLQPVYREVLDPLLALTYAAARTERIRLGVAVINLPYLSPAYLAKHGEPERPEDLLEHNCIVYSFLSNAREWRLTGPEGEPHVVPIKGTLHSNNGLVNRAAALSGVGIVLLPTFYIGEQLRAGELKPILCKFAPPALAVYAVYPERRNLTPKVRAFVDFLATTFGPEPPWEKGWTLE